ncbi:divergent polysaccharide deacetylase family protein [Candidatus Omnitrophota bacterium]
MRPKKRVVRARKRGSKKNALIVALLFIIVVETSLLFFFSRTERTEQPVRKVAVKQKREQATVVEQRQEQVAAVAQKPEQAAALEPVAIAAKAQVAIVIDDWGYNLKNVQFLQSVDFPITISVLPFLAYSNRIARFTESENIEVILHLPMEPQRKEEIGLERHIVLTEMTKEQIIKVLNDSMSNIGGVTGVSNHMGSKATENYFVMKAIFEELLRQDLYFLDSLVTVHSVGARLARKTGVRFAQRSIFLDNKAEKDYITGQLKLLIQEAKENRKAVGIGHDRKLTLQTIQEYFKANDLKDIELVFVSELAN